MSGINQQIETVRKEIQDRQAKLNELYRARTPEPIQDYELVDSDGGSVRLSALFGDHQDMILIHNMGRGCSYCTMWADGFIGFQRHFANRAAFVVSSPDKPEVQARIKADRSWNFPMVSTADSSLTKDLGYLGDEGYWPGVSALHRNPDGSIVRTNHDEFGPLDSYNAAWHLLNLLEGGSDGWEPTPPA